MTKFYTMQQGGKRRVKGKNYEHVVGTRAEVWHGSAHHTKGDLTKGDLMMNKRGRIVSRRKHASAKRERRLEKAGYKTKKGMFGYIGMTKGRKGRKGHKTRKHRGGMGVNSQLSPAHFDGRGVGTSGVDLQFVAGNAAS